MAYQVDLQGREIYKRELENKELKRRAERDLSRLKESMMAQLQKSGLENRELKCKNQYQLST